MGVFVRFFGHFYPSLGANPLSHFLAQVFFFCGNRPKSASLEPCNGCLAYLEPKLWIKKQKLVKMSDPTNPNLGWITPYL